MNLNGRVALVTGASSGIGRDVAVQLGKRGVTVLATGRDRAALDDVIGRTGGRAIVADLAAPDGWRQVVDAAGDVDILVNNAGIGWAGEAVAMPVETVDAVLAVNLRSVFLLTHALLPAMVAKKSGAVVFVTSIAGYTAPAKEAVYSATKAAVSTYADALRVELAGTGVTVSDVAPGVVDTPFFDRRGTPYDRGFPKPIPPSAITDAVIRAIEKGTPRQIVPRWLGGAARIRGGMPGLYRVMSSRFM